MSGPIVRTGATRKFSENWDRIFGEGAASGTKKTPKRAKRTAAGAKKTAKAAKKYLLWKPWCFWQFDL